MDTDQDRTPNEMQPSEYFESVLRMTRDLRNASITLSFREARFLVDAYYAMQRDRIRAAHQTRTLVANEEPHDIISWVQDQRHTLEGQVAKALDAYSASLEYGVWARSIVGIGPIISAGLAANIDISKAPTVGHVWRFAGLDPTVKWEKGKKRPWNGSLKRLCFLIGESFVKVSNNNRDVYGKVYASRKIVETRNNEALMFKDQAALSLASKNWSDDTVAKSCYEKGMLPPARIHLRAQRVAVKLFLSHYHHVLHEVTYGVAPPKPYIVTRDPLHNFIAPPNWPMVAKD